MTVKKNIGAALILSTGYFFLGCTHLSLKNTLKDTSIESTVEEPPGLTQSLKENLSAIEEGSEVAQSSHGETLEIETRLASLKKKFNSTDSDIKKLITQAKGNKVEARESGEEQYKAQKESAAEKKQLSEYKAFDSAMRELETVKKAKSDLENKLADVNERNESLLRQVAALKTDLQSSRKVAAGAREAKEPKASLIERQKQSAYTRELESRILKLSAENKKFEEELGALKIESEKVNLAYAHLKEEYEKHSGDLDKNEIELARRAERILQFQDDKEKLQLKLEEMRLNLEAQIKESATLREQCVAKQLENQNLKNKLHQLELKLVDLQSKWQEATNIFRAQEETQASLSKDTQSKIQDKKIHVELFPQASTLEK
jgi:chromosome segregation ATPase